MAYSYTQYTVASSNDTTTTYATPPYRSGKAATDISVAVDGVTKIATTDYTISGTSVTFTSAGAPLAGSVVRIARNTSQNVAPSDYSENTILTSAQLNATQEQLFFMAQEALDQASKTTFAAQSFYTSGTSAPSTGSVGDLFFNTATGLLQIYNGTVWQTVNSRGHKQSFTTTAPQTNFNPTHSVDDNTLVFLNGVLQNKGGDYTTTPITVIFSVAVAAGNIVEIVSFPNSTSGFSLDNNAKVTFGSANDLTIHSDGTSSYITEQNTTGNLFIDSNHLIMRVGDGNPVGSDATPQDYYRFGAVGGATGGIRLWTGAEGSGSDASYGSWRTLFYPAANSLTGGMIQYGKVEIRDGTGQGQHAATSGQPDGVAAGNSGNLAVENQADIGSKLIVGTASNPIKADSYLYGDLKVRDEISGIGGSIKIRGHLTTKTVTATNVNQTDFGGYSGMRIFYTGSGNSTWELKESPSDGYTWVIMNASSHTITIHRGTTNPRVLKHLDGSSVSSGADKTIASGGIVEIVYDATVGCYYMFGSGIS